MKKRLLWCSYTVDGFFNGSASLDFYSSDYLINENVIIVTMNYRLNAFGDFIDVKKLI